MMSGVGSESQRNGRGSGLPGSLGQGGQGGQETLRTKTEFFEHPPCLSWPEAPCSLSTQAATRYKGSTGPEENASGTGPIVGATDPRAVGGGRALGSAAIEVEGL